ncbi:MAG: DUF2842 domain-containing protein [Alphaproteobacteria bacterium]|nr:MAG: DUF2842 domain-containing protein [Alphaproteobacteria bacterium]
MRDKPSLRIPFGVLALLVGLTAYGIAVANYVPGWIGSWPVWAQTIIYLVLGIVWLLPLRRFLIWMETGRWS